MTVNRKLTRLALALFATCPLLARAESPDHPWKGKHVAFLGDSITEPNQKNEIYWQILEKELGIVPHVYAVGGYQWDRIYPMAQRLVAEQGSSIDAIMILLGTNDFNSGVPIGEWDEVRREDVYRRGETLHSSRRHPIKNMTTFRGRINTVMEYLKANFPDQQIVLMTPTHRGYAKFDEKNVQPPECFANKQEKYFEEYIQTLREAADRFSVPLIDLYRESGLLPTDLSYAKYFREGGGNDNLHPGSLGHRRIARVIAERLRVMPSDFKSITGAK